jgi:hypothetical protein
MHERRALVSQAAVRAISGYRGFAMGALHATEGRFPMKPRGRRRPMCGGLSRELKMRYLPRRWLEIIAVRI